MRHEGVREMASDVASSVTFEEGGYITLYLPLAVTWVSQTSTSEANDPAKSKCSRNGISMG
jgi:hypothetical protein